MSIRIRMRGKSRDGVAEIKALIRHPMETGVRINNKTGKPHPAKFIDTVAVAVNGTTVVNAQWSGAVSVNPYMAVKVNASAGDEIVISLSDNTGEAGTKTLVLK